MIFEKNAKKHLHFPVGCAIITYVANLVIKLKEVQTNGKV